MAHPHAIPLFATRPASTPAAMARLDHYLETLLAAGFKPLDTLSIVQLVAQLVVGHTMWTQGIDSIELSSPPTTAVASVEKVLAKWNPDRELELGVDALIHGFERLL